MSEKPKLDIIIFGATGYTGKCVLTEFIQLNRCRYSLAVAGRNHEKLKELLEWATEKTGEDVSKTSIIIADCSDQDSLNSMASQGKVIINCCGPYQFYGEPVVEACIENGTHHLDVSGEPEYMKRIQLMYHETAEAKHVYVVSACGFDSVPADFGVIHFVNNFDGVVNSIESHVMFISQSPNEPYNNIGTWKSAVFSLTDRKIPPALREKQSQLFNRPKLEPRLKPRWPVHRSEVFDHKFGVPFPGADESVVFRTQNLLYKEYGQRPVQYYPYFVVNSFTALLGFALIGFFLVTLGSFSWGQRLLIRVSFVDGGYGFTAIAIILGAFTVLAECESMPSVGGVYTPGAAFSKTSYLKKLEENGFSIKILQSQSK